MFGKTPLHPRADACDINSDLTISEIDIEIFKLGTPIARKGEFNTCAGCPTGLDVFKVRGCKRNAAQSKIVVGLDLTVCNTARAVNQRAGREQKANAAPGGSEPR